MSYKKRCVIHFWGCFSHSSENLRELQSSLEKRNKPLKIPKIKSKDMGWSIKKFKLIKIETLIKQIEEKVFSKGPSEKIIFRQGDLPAAVDDVGDFRHNVHQHRHLLLQRAPVLWVLEGWPTEEKKDFQNTKINFRIGFTRTFFRGSSLSYKCPWPVPSGEQWIIDPVSGEQWRVTQLFGGQ